MGRLHAENLAGRVPSASLAGVVDAVEPVARAVGGRHDVAWSVSLEAMLHGHEVDGVVIAAPTALHSELVELAARAGKHVLCEKPLGFDAGDARGAVAAAEAADVALQVGFQRRFDSGWVALREALDRGELGRLHLVRCSHRDARPPDAGLGDLFADMAVHDLDAARWLGGEVAEVFALPRAGVGEAPALAAAIVLRFESGALGVVDVSRDARYGFECSAELIGSQATGRIGHGLRRGELELLHDGRAEARLSADHAERHEAAYVNELEHFGHVATGRGKPIPTGEDAVAALELASAARRSAEAAMLTAPAGAGGAGA
jgi:myo-inositol 2-dehydrogenase/D-chiro-inositol 1-dehydrogenase